MALDGGLLIPVGRALITTKSRDFFASQWTQLTPQPASEEWAGGFWLSFCQICNAASGQWRCFQFLISGKPAVRPPANGVPSAFKFLLASFRPLATWLRIAFLTLDAKNNYLRPWWSRVVEYANLLGIATCMGPSHWERWTPQHSLFVRSNGSPWKFSFVIEDVSEY